MTMDKGTLKVFFGVIIFMFSLALAYFAADYVKDEQLLSYWTMLVIFGGLYAIIGIAVYQIYPISLGFLFSADILILHLLFENFGDIDPMLKVVILALVLALLYMFAWSYMKDDPLPEMGTPPAPPMPPASPTPIA
jgi:hypothetical protein